MTFNGAIMQLVEMRENSMMPVAFKPYFDKVIETLLDVEPAPQWIPCTPETMPEEEEWIGTKRFGTTISDKVLVTFERPDGSRFVKDLCFQDGKLSGFDQQSIDVFNKGSIPIMWMPWPEPYNPESEE